MRRYEITDVHRVFDGFMKVDEAQVSLEEKDGGMSKPSKRLSVERGDSAAILVHDTEADRLIFARQFRFPTAGKGDPWLVEIVAGKVDEGESPEEAARRETEEEVGLQVEGVEPVAEFYPSPGGLSERISVFYARVRKGAPTGEGGGVDEGEDVERVEMTVQEALDRMRRGEIRDGKTLIALQWLALRQNP